MTALHPFTCMENRALTPTIRLIRLQPVASILHFAPGQYVEAKLSNGEWLPLSIANVPHSLGQLEFHLRHGEHSSPATAWLADIESKPILYLRGPSGQCVLPDAPCPLAFLAGGTGYAPIKALLTQALCQKQWLFPIKLYWGIHRAIDAYDKAHLEALQSRFPHFSYQLVLSSPQGSWKGKRGLVHDVLQQDLSDLKQWVIYASGPFPMIKAAFTLYQKHGLAANQFNSDIHTQLLSSWPA